MHAFFSRVYPPPPLPRSPLWLIVDVRAEDDDDAVEVLDDDCVFVDQRAAVTGSENAPLTAKDGSTAEGGEGQQGVMSGTKRAAEEEEEDAGQGNDKKMAGGVGACNGTPKRAKV